MISLSKFARRQNYSNWSRLSGLPWIQCQRKYRKSQWKSQIVSQEARERARSVATYYNQSDIERVAELNSIRLTPWSVLYTGGAETEKNLLQSAQYLHRELPVRVAHRIKSFHSLPFIIGCNPIILSVHDLYIKSFKQLYNFRPIKNRDDVNEYASLLKRLLDEHRNVVSDISKGFRQCSKHINEQMLESHLAKKFLDRMLSSRLGIRLLAMHHILMHGQEKDHIGMIHTKFYPAKAVEKWTQFVSEMCEYEYGKAPKVRLSGHIHAHFPYIPIPLDYILCEILKNAMRFTVEHHDTGAAHHIPDIVVTIANNPIDFVIKISDRGGGVPHDLMNQILEYNFSTAENQKKSREDPMSDMLSMVNQGPNGNSKMHGHGFGLPMSRCYAEYMGGSLTIQSMQGIGTDVYIRLKRIDKEPGSFRF